MDGDGPTAVSRVGPSYYMSYWGVHVGFAGVVTILFLAPLHLSRRTRWAVLAASGSWAVVPDLYHFVPALRPWYKPLVHDSAYSNLFWLHGLIDDLDPGDRVAYSVAMWALLLVVSLAVEYLIQTR